MDHFNMSLPAYNLNMDLQRVKKSNAGKIGIGNVVDFEKYRKLEKKLQFLKKFANNVNNNKLIVSLLVQFELEFIMLSNDFLAGNSENSQNLEKFIEEYKDIIKITDFFVEQSNKYPKVVKINSNELETLSFIKKRLNEVISSNTENSFVIPDYLKGFLKHHKVETTDDGLKLGSNPNSDLFSSAKTYKLDINLYPDLYLGYLYFIYNSINPDFFDDSIVHFINLKFSTDFKKLSEDKISNIKRDYVLLKTNLRYSEVLEKLA